MVRLMAEEIQTRNEEGELKYFPSLRAAFAHVQTDPTVWKVSWSYHSERVRLVRTVRLVKEGSEWKYDTSWVYEPILVEE